MGFLGGCGIWFWRFRFFPKGPLGLFFSQGFGFGGFLLFLGPRFFSFWGTPNFILKLSLGFPELFFFPPFWGPPLFGRIWWSSPKGFFPLRKVFPPLF